MEILADTRNMGEVHLCSSRQTSVLESAAVVEILFCIYKLNNRIEMRGGDCGGN